MAVTQPIRSSVRGFDNRLPDVDPSEKNQQAV